MRMNVKQPKVTDAVKKNDPEKGTVWDGTITFQQISVDYRR